MEAGKTGSVKMPNNFDTESLDALTRNCINMVTRSVAHYGGREYKKKLYFAGPWFDERAAILYNCCENIEGQLRSKSMYKVFYPKNEVNESPLQAFNKNVQHVTECDALIALVSRKDVGTAWEIGMAYALGKPVYLLGYDESTFLSHTNVMLAFTGKCLTIASYAKFLTEGLSEEDYVKINNEWEGIE